MLCILILVYNYYWSMFFPFYIKFFIVSVLGINYVLKMKYETSKAIQLYIYIRCFLYLYIFFCIIIYFFVLQLIQQIYATHDYCSASPIKIVLSHSDNQASRSAAYKDRVRNSQPIRTYQRWRHINMTSCDDVTCGYIYFIYIYMKYISSVFFPSWPH